MSLAAAVPTRKEIPRVIWSFWHDGDLPPVVRLCVDSWRVHNAGYAIRVLTLETCGAWMQGIDARDARFEATRSLHPHQHVSDLVRAVVLAAHGGVWLDASVLCTRPLEWMQEAVNARPERDFVGFYADAMTSDYRFPVLENWIFACTAACPFMAAWRDAVIELNVVGAKRFLAGCERSALDFQRIPKASQAYLSMHVAALRVMQLQHLGGVPRIIHQIWIESIKALALS